MARGTVTGTLSGMTRSTEPPLCLPLAGAEEGALQAENKGTIYYFWVDVSVAMLRAGNCAML